MLLNYQKKSLYDFTRCWFTQDSLRSTYFLLFLFFMIIQTGIKVNKTAAAQTPGQRMFSAVMYFSGYTQYEESLSFSPLIFVQTQNVIPSSQGLINGWFPLNLRTLASIIVDSLQSSGMKYMGGQKLNYPTIQINCGKA